MSCQSGILQSCPELCAVCVHTLMLPGRALVYLWGLGPPGGHRLPPTPEGRALASQEGVCYLETQCRPLGHSQGLKGP